MRVVKKVLGAVAKVRSPFSGGDRHDPYAAFESGDYALAVAGFTARLKKKKKDALAMHHMGWLSENGHVDEATAETAKDWYSKAAENGHHLSALALSDLCYTLGEFKEAFDWDDYAIAKEVPGAKAARDRAYRAAGMNLQWWR